MFFRVSYPPPQTRYGILISREDLEKLNDKKAFSIDFILMKMRNTLVFYYLRLSCVS